ncbi:hypothetical protein FOMPIDRAFT_1046910 [Fomitopsis schrenkii]|uniref:Uncharacterized protein n=1 Tax=Fomitopsis schrenkii TaxID=2126942 RepID=S8EJ76_FOMSC|nr:hypothetical protein FOMPIDRAFT_1046910 [Fomitopsis schrenkii]
MTVDVLKDGTRRRARRCTLADAPCEAPARRYAAAADSAPAFRCRADSLRPRSPALHPRRRIAGDSAASRGPSILGRVVGIVLPISGAASAATAYSHRVHSTHGPSTRRTPPSAFPLPRLFSSDLASLRLSDEPDTAVGQGGALRLGRA